MVNCEANGFRGLFCLMSDTCYALSELESSTPIDLPTEQVLKNRTEGCPIADYIMQRRKELASGASKEIH